MNKIIREYMASLGAIGGKATGAAKRRDKDDPDYYKRISAKAAKARAANKKKRDRIA